MIARRDLKRWFFVLFFSLIFSLIPWESAWNSTHGYNFVDRDVYRDIFLNQPPYGEPCSFFNIVKCMTNERLWDYIVRFFLGQGVRLEYIFHLVSFFVIATFSRFLVITNAKIWPAFFLINPLVIDLAFSQLRLSLALSLLYSAHLAKGRYLKLLLTFCSIFIHTASIIFIAMYFLAYFSGKNFFAARGKVIIIFFLVLTGVLFSLLLGPLRELVLSYIGDRRAKYEYRDLSSSLIYSLFWVGLLALSLLQGRQFLSRVENRFSIIILSLVAFNIVVSGYSTRFIAASFPAIISYMLNLAREYKVIAFSALICYACAQWTFWLFVGGS